MAVAVINYCNIETYNYRSGYHWGIHIPVYSLQHHASHLLAPQLATGALARQSLTESSVYSIGAHSEDGVQFAVATRQMQHLASEHQVDTLLLQATANSQVSVRAHTSGDITALPQLTASALLFSNFEEACSISANTSTTVQEQWRQRKMRSRLSSAACASARPQANAEELSLCALARRTEPDKHLEVDQV
eukprot:17669-Heterococcus_DN1.PRE.1